MFREKTFTLQPTEFVSEVVEEDVPPKDPKPPGRPHLWVRGDCEGARIVAKSTIALGSKVIAMRMHSASGFHQLQARCQSIADIEPLSVLGSKGAVPGLAIMLNGFPLPSMLGLLRTATLMSS